MKKLFILIALSMALIFSGCSKDEPKDEPKEDKNVTENTEEKDVNEVEEKNDTDEDEDTEEPESEKTYSESLSKGEYMPKLVLADKDGNEVTLDELQDDGKVLFVNLWSTTWPYCVDEMPDLVEINNREDVNVVLINLGNPIDEVLEVLKDKGAENLPLYFEPNNAEIKVNDVFSPSPIPATYIFDKDGNYVEFIIGAIGKDEFNKYIDKYTK